MKLLEPHEHLVRSGRGFNAPLGLLISGVSVAVAVVVVVQIFAAGTPVAFEAENGTLAGGATTSVLAGASGGSTVKFGHSATPTPSPSGSQTNNCAPSPHLCGYPDATNTGPSVAPTHTVTGLEIDSAGTYSGYIVNGCVTILASNVTFTQSIVHATNGCNATISVPYYTNPTNVIIDHVEIDGAHAIDTDNHDMAALTGSFSVARFLNVHGGGDGIDVGDNCTVNDNYVHDQWIDSNPGGPPHVDGLQSAGGSNYTITHNTLDNTTGNDSPIILGADLDDITNAVVSNNLLIPAAGEPSLRAGHNSGSAYRAKGIQFLNNRFSYKNAGSYTYNFLPDGTNPIVFTGNVVDSDGSAIPNYNSAGNGTTTYGQ